MSVTKALDNIRVLDLTRGAGGGPAAGRSAIEPPAPERGEQTVQILGELGLDAAAIDAAKAAGAI